LHQRCLRIAAVFAVTMLAACSGNSGPVVPGSAPPAAQSDLTQSCAQLLPGDDMRCYAEFRDDLSGTILKAGTRLPSSTQYATPAGYGPNQLRSAYKLPSTSDGAGQTVAIVDAYDDPNAASDLNVYRSVFKLPACTTSTGCFKKVSQSGTTKYPSSDGGWAQEESLDLDMVSAICPNCHIVLVEANTAAGTNLAAAVDEAVKLGAAAVSNSYGGPETSSSNSAYNHPGHVITASAGDNGTGASQPCSYATVVCVGGTSLVPAGNTRGWAETAWSGSGSACSRYVAKPSWQTDLGCRARSEADVSAVADPNTGVAVYDSYAYMGYAGWMVFGGTSVSSPLVASVYALAHNASSMTYAKSLWQHGGTSAFNDVTSGSNGSCSIAYICHARVGYDGPTGWGTPNGIAAF
jgi:subtilase family serine protease